MLPLLSADLFGGVKTDDEGVSFTFPPQLAKVNLSHSLRNVMKSRHLN